MIINKKLPKAITGQLIFNLFFVFCVKTETIQKNTQGEVALEDKLFINAKNLSSQSKTKCDQFVHQRTKFGHGRPTSKCRQLPLEQPKSRQILENNSEGVLIRK